MSTAASIISFVALSINQRVQVCKLLLQIHHYDEKKLHLIAKATIVSKIKRMYIHTHSFSPILYKFLRICEGINHFAD